MITRPDPAASREENATLERLTQLRATIREQQPITAQEVKAEIRRWIGDGLPGYVRALGKPEAMRAWISGQASGQAKRPVRVTYDTPGIPGGRWHGASPEGLLTAVGNDDRARPSSRGRRSRHGYSQASPAACATGSPLPTTPAPPCSVVGSLPPSTHRRTSPSPATTKTSTPPRRSARPSPPAGPQWRPRSRPLPLSWKPPAVLTATPARCSQPCSMTPPPSSRAQPAPSSRVQPLQRRPVQ
jgi:hypothetical protein